MDRKMAILMVIATFWLPSASAGMVEDLGDCVSSSEDSDNAGCLVAAGVKNVEKCENKEKVHPFGSIDWTAYVRVPSGGVVEWPLRTEPATGKISIKEVSSESFFEATYVVSGVVTGSKLVFTTADGGVHTFAGGNFASFPTTGTGNFGPTCEFVLLAWVPTKVSFGYSDSVYGLARDAVCAFVNPCVVPTTGATLADVVGIQGTGYTQLLP
jgi:hypothetical protein